MIVNISEAKANLSKLVNMVYHGEKVVKAKNNLPLVERLSGNLGAVAKEQEMGNLDEVKTFFV